MAQDFAKLEGVVVDSVLGQPIAGVKVTAIPTGVFATTDGAGHFQLTRIPPGAITVSFESAFHRLPEVVSITIREGESRSLTIRLAPNIVTHPGVEVVADRRTKLATQVYANAEIRKSPCRTAGEFLGAVGVYLQSDGRAQYAGLRGFAPQSVLVLIDGVPANPDGTSFDLSTIALPTVERIEIYHGNAAATFGPNALGGAINLVSRQSTPAVDAGIAATVGRGSFGSKSVGATGQIAAAVTGIGSFDYQDQSNDFDYLHPYNGTQTRQNNYRLQRSGFIRLHASRLSGLSVSWRLSNSRSGVPGAVFQESPSAAAARGMQLISAGYQWSTVRVDLNYRELSQSFRDRQAFVPYDIEYRQIARSVRLAWEPPSRAITPSAAIDLLRERFFNEDHQSRARSLPQVGRETLSASSALLAAVRQRSIRFTSDFRFRADLLDGRAEWSPYFATGVSWSSLLDLALCAGYGESYRRPPIDALFWREDVFSIGNPDLKSESAISRDLTLRAAWSRTLPIQFSQAWFESDVVNLIAWRRQFDGKYKPVNVNQARLSGRELSIELHDPNDRITAKYSRQSLSAIDESVSGGYYGQVIPFRPNRIESFSVDFDVKPVRINYRYSFIGERFIREANTKALPGYALHDVVVEWRQKRGRLEHRLQLSLSNLTDRHYELLERMPMPPRNANFTYAIEW